MVDLLSDVTGINREALDTRDMSRFNTAKRLSWASKRTSTRLEDMAYCLLGIFGVDISYLYGEGERAFIRLQQEIIKSSDDHSIFAWTSSPEALTWGYPLLGNNTHKRTLLNDQQRSEHQVKIGAGMW